MSQARQLQLDRADLQSTVLSPRAARILSCFHQASTVTEVALASGCEVPMVYEIVQALRRDRLLLRCGHNGYIATAALAGQPAARLPPIAQIYAVLTDTPTHLHDLAAAGSVTLAKARSLCAYLAAQGLARRTGPRSCALGSEDGVQAVRGATDLANAGRILLALAKPLPVQELADSLGLTIRTIRKHLRELKRQAAVIRIVGAVYADSDWVAAQGGLAGAIAWFEEQGTPGSAAIAARLARRLKRSMPRTSPVADRLYALLTEPKRPIEMRAAVGLPIPTITGHMRALIAKGRVVRLARGLYLRADVERSPIGEHPPTSGRNAQAPASISSHC